MWKLFRWNQQCTCVNYIYNPKAPSPQSEPMPSLVNTTKQAPPNMKARTHKLRISEYISPLRISHFNARSVADNLRDLPR